MPIPGITVRRATLDDLETLRGLWREARLPEHELERRFTEFQLAIDAHDWIVGCLGLRFAGPHGHVHSLGTRRAEMDEALADLLFERILALAHQNGTLRLWTRDPACYSGERGFGPASPAELRELPPAFGPAVGAWHTWKLRDAPLKLIAAEEQLEAFLEMERSRTERMIRRGRFLKLAATTVAAGIFALALAVLYKTLRRERRTFRP